MIFIPVNDYPLSLFTIGEKGEQQYVENNIFCVNN